MGRKRRAHERYSDDEERPRPRPRRVFIGEFRPENISRLFRKYHGEWHPRSDERFLTQNEFVDLIDELHTTKITEIHDEGMTRIRHGELPFDIPTAKRRNSRRVRSTDSYRPTRDLSTSADSYRPASSRYLSSLASQPSTRTPTPQPRSSRLSTPFTYEQDKPSSRLSEIRASSAQTTPFHATATVIKTQPLSSPAEQKSRLANIPATTFALPSNSLFLSLQDSANKSSSSSSSTQHQPPENSLPRAQTKTNTPPPPPQPESLYPPPPPPPPHYESAIPPPPPTDSPHHALKQQQSHRRAVTAELMNTYPRLRLPRLYTTTPQSLLSRPQTPHTMHRNSNDPTAAP
ncbi:hypothetical protein V495_03675 [Pseudogymnoascus sp. VKM F-4514 (FW-929)]|nr:hypothetical protein V495_03675 [Pseudogymnoascus sp. VKM F-4514 (FW-929)]